MMSKQKQRYMNLNTIIPYQVSILKRWLDACNWGSLQKTTIYDVKTKAKIHEFKHDGSVNSVAFSNDGSMLATGDLKQNNDI